MKNFTKKLNRMVTCLMGGGMVLFLEPVSAMQLDPARVREESGNPERCREQPRNGAVSTNTSNDEGSDESLETDLSFDKPYNHDFNNSSSSTDQDPDPSNEIFTPPDDYILRTTWQKVPNSSGRS